MKLNTYSVIGAGLLLAAGCVCLYLKDNVSAAALLGAALGLFGKPPIEVGK